MSDNQPANSKWLKLSSDYVSQVGPPGVNSDLANGFSQGSIWYNNVHGDYWISESDATGAAVWRSIGIIDDTNALNNKTYSSSKIESLIPDTSKFASKIGAMISEVTAINTTAQVELQSGTYPAGEGYTMKATPTIGDVYTMSLSGDSFRTNGNQQINFAVQIGFQTLINFPVNANVASEEAWDLELELTVKDVSADPAVDGLVNLQVKLVLQDPLGSAITYVKAVKDYSVANIKIANQIRCSAIWSVADASNILRCQQCITRYN
jgi:hypothetical protein